MSEGGLKVSFINTLGHMEYRKSIRKYRGSYHPTNSGVTLFLVFLLLLFWGFQEFFATEYSIGLRLEWQNGNTENEWYDVVIGFILTAILLLLLVAAQVRYNVSEAIYIVSVFLMAMFIVIIVVESSSRFQIQYILFVCYVCLQICVLVVYHVRRNYIPKMIKKQWWITRARILHGYPVKEEVITSDEYARISGNSRVYKVAFKYTGPLQSWFGMLGRVDRVVYIGCLNDAQEAHGYGEWKDNSWHGEQLRGMWRNGKPVAPFNSRETGSGSGFVSMRIAFWTIRADHFKQISWLPTFRKGSVGVGSSEACVYGVFFKDYPQVELLSGPTPYAIGTSSDPNVALGQALLSCAYQSPNPVLHPQQASKLQRWETGHIRWSLNFLDRDFEVDENQLATPHSVTVTANKERGLLVSGYKWKDPSSVCNSLSIQLLSNTSQLENAAVENTQVQQQGQSSVKNGGDARQVNLQVDDSCQFDDQQGSLQIEGWTPKIQQGNQDVIVFIHGFNCALADSLKILGQFLALANFTSEVKSVVFSWPAVRDVMYMKAKSITESFTCSSEFVSMLSALSADGYNSFHIVTHSMGVRVLMAALPFLETALHGQCHPSDSANEKLQEALDVVLRLNICLETITLLNPDYSLEEFVNGKGQRLRQLCPIITIYGDKQDGALYFSSIGNALYKYARKIPRLPVCRTRSTRDKLQRHPSCFGLRLDLMLGKELDLVIQPGAQDDHDNNKRQESYLDVDVIDTTFMEANVHAMRHNYFNLNRELVEDIRDLITTNRRAGQRNHRLENKQGNVYQFLVAPSYVQNA